MLTAGPAVTVKGDGQAWDTKLLQLLQPYETELSVRCGEAEANGEDELTGLMAALLERYTDGLWRSDSADALPERR